MTPDELDTLADAWDVLCDSTDVDWNGTPGPLARDHAALLRWAEKAADDLRRYEMLAGAYADDSPSALRDQQRVNALLSEYDKRWGTTATPDPALPGDAAAG